MASWRPLRLPAFVALAVLGLAGCKRAGGEPQPERAAAGSEAVGSSLPNAPAQASAPAHEQEHDCSSHAPEQHGPRAPSATMLSASARSRVTALQVLMHGSAVIIRKQSDGWVMGGPNGCSVSSRRIERALENLSALKVVAGGEPPQQHERQIILLEGDDVLVQYDVGVEADGVAPARVPDGSVVQLRGLDRGVLSARPDDWCSARQ